MYLERIRICRRIQKNETQILKKKQQLEKGNSISLRELPELPSITETYNNNFHQSTKKTPIGDPKN